MSLKYVGLVCARVGGAVGVGRWCSPPNAVRLPDEGHVNMVWMVHVAYCSAVLASEMERARLITSSPVMSRQL